MLTNQENNKLGLNTAELKAHQSVILIRNTRCSQAQQSRIESLLRIHAAEVDYNSFMFFTEEARLNLSSFFFFFL